MGNRALIKAKDNTSRAVYLHWNGGRDSVEAFLKYCELRKFRGFDDDYGMARFCQVVGNFFGVGGLSLGIMDISEGEDGGYMDNVNGWEIVGRRGFSGIEQDHHDLQSMLLAIDEAQPANQQLGRKFITAEIISTENLKIGDKVLLQNYHGEVENLEVVGFKNGKPYVNRYLNEGSYEHNPNNYIRDEFVRVCT